VSPFRLTLFGGFDLRDGQGAAVSIRSKKGRCLLAYLALAQGRQTHRDILAELLWGERGDAQARRSLNQELYRLRGLFPEQIQERFAVDAESVGLDDGLFEVDVAGFEGGSGAADSEIAALYKGELLAGLNAGSEGFNKLWFANAQAGKLTLGQGPTASDGSVEEDLSGTTVITNASFSDVGSALAFRVSGTRGTSSGVTVGGLFSSQDGLSRDDRIRYDSPTLGGAKLSTSWVDGDEWDAALRYGREFNGTELALAGAYWDASPTAQKTGMAVSASAKAPFGTSLTGGYSVEDLEATAREDEEFWQVKLGHDFKITDIGGTAVSLTYAQTDNAGATNREGTYVGLAAVQNVAKIGAEIYALFGQYDADLPGVVTEDITVGGVGARVKF